MQQKLNCVVYKVPQQLRLCIMKQKTLSLWEQLLYLSANVIWFCIHCCKSTKVFDTDTNQTTMLGLVLVLLNNLPISLNAIRV